MGRRPLDGVRVLDLTRVLSGPHCTRMLCDLGAEVIKVEPPAGDTTRFANPRVHGLSGYFVQQNAGKRNISLDLSKPEAVAILLRLAEACDVLVENFRGGVADRMGVGYEAVSSRNPGIVYASISGYGATGPWRHRRAYAPVVAAETGLTKAQGDSRMTVTGAEDAVYSNDPHSHADIYAGMEAAVAILAALVQRNVTNEGAWIDVSMAETMLYANEHTYDNWWDGPMQADWVSSFGPGDYPVLKARNGEVVVISGHPAEKITFDRFIAAMERPDLGREDRFVDVLARLQNLDALVAEMRAWASQMEDAAAIETAMDAQKLATGTLRSARDLASTAWAAARHAVAEVSDRGAGSIRVPNPPWHFSTGDTSVRGRPCYRGEDNREVLRELLDLTEDDLRRLEHDGVLSSRVPASQHESAPSNPLPVGE